MTLKQISPSQVELGMFIHAFQGNWLRHPFWRAKFLISDDEKLHAVRDSALDAVVIDTERGIDLPAARDPRPAVRPAPHAAPRALGRAAPRREAPAPSAPAAPAPVAVAREFGNARHVAGQARKVVSKVFFEARLGKAPRVAEVVPVVQDIHASIERNAHAFSGLMRCRSELEPIYQHMLSVSALMVSLARQMKLTPQETRDAGTAGLLLDIGVSRLNIDADDLAAGLHAVDTALWHRHCYVGHDLLAAAGDVPQSVLHAVLHHHEQLDGAGFPQRLPSRQIDRLSRMAAICDRFDLLVSGTATGQPLDPSEAMRVMMQTDGVFDREILAKFQEALGVYPVGSFVALQSGHLAMVVDQARGDPELPTVRLFYSLEKNAPVKPRTLALATCNGSDAITAAADLDTLDLPPAPDLRDLLFSGAGLDGKKA